MKPITFAIAGCGNRGTKYAAKLLDHPDTAEIAAIADNRAVRTAAIQRHIHLPENRVFDGIESLLEQPRLADVLIIATQDAQHKDHAIAAMKKGYHLILEKPVSNRLEECAQIAQVAKECDRHVLVCHVLRYTPFYRQVKNLLDQGVVGKIESIQADEQVGYYHYAHSYVRGNWHNEETSSPMILAKCCHDMDIILWLAGKKCKKVSSFGSLDYFCKENCPAGAKERCTDGCTVDCVYNAQKFYLSRIPGWPSNVLHPEPNEENIMEILRTTDYGKCVYRMDNNVVDHQVVNLLLEDGITVNFQMVGFTNKMTRGLRIMGTEGEIWGDFHSRTLYWQRFGEAQEHEVDLNAISTDFSGHGGGDGGLISTAIDFFREDPNADLTSITPIDRSVESHYVAFAAEESRVNEGKVVDMDEFMKTR